MAEKVMFQNVAEAARDYQLLFGANKNLYRVIPKLQSGNKPGKDRIFWSWWLDSGRPKNTKKETLDKLRIEKVSTLAGRAMRFHPHGSDANEGVIAGEGQKWNNNVLTIVPKGSFGSARGDLPANGRYIGAKLSEYCIDCFFDDFDAYSVPMKQNYSGDLLEPEYLPSKYPHILVNPQISGIGYGLASNIPPFNFTELMRATIKLIRDKDAKIMLIPDSPTGADIVDIGDFKKINKSGVGKMTLRASSEIDYKRNIITFTSIPLQTSTERIINKIISLKNSKKKLFEEIIDIKDYTQDDIVKLELYLSSEANADDVLDELYERSTDLKMTYPVGITFVDDYKPYTMGVKDLLLRWIEYRRDAVTSMLNNKLQQIETKLHMNEVLLMVFNGENAEETVKICRKSSSKKETVEKLMKRYHITSIQGGVIADMHLYQFNKESYQKFKEERKELLESYEKTESILSSDTKIDDLIISQLEDGIKKYGRPRMSKVIRDDEEENKIPNTEHLIAISESGYIKKLSLKHESVGPCGPDNGNVTVIQINNRDNILLVDSNGSLSRISVSAIPNMEYEDTGVELSRYFRTSGRIIAAMQFPQISSLDSSELCMILTTRLGFSKRVYLKEFKKISSNTICMGLNEGDELVSALFTTDESISDICIFTNLGDGVRRPISDIKISGKTAKGTRQINLKSGEYVVGASKIDTKRKYVFYITSAGRAKLTELKYFPQMQRKDDAVSMIILEKNETLVGVASVNKKDHVMIYRKKSEPVLLEISDIDIAARMAKGKKYVTTPKGESVIAFKVFK